METSITRKTLRNYNLRKDDNRYLYSVPAHILNDMKISSWKLNREVDQKRVKKIAKSIRESKRVIGIIYLADLNNKLVCFDGNHRRLALEEVNIDTENILVLIMWNADQSDVVNEFNSINLAVSVASIHTSNKIADSNKIAIKEYVAKLVARYPTLSSTTSACQRPNFNRDMLEQDLADLLDENDDMTAEEMICTLKQLNKEYAIGNVKLGSPLKPAVLAKCNQYGLWLFCESRTVSRKQFGKLRR